ncbi:hypothetical protein [Leptospira stimsonii]|uniref:Uncharacterized protein n=1 Tax=Leptospira stimsonii TaxID=2202203 RepID=A0A8B3CLI8_9LEPT|nr:hypothetical protein [Leptospira stimsonii]RHX83849.1 hypothetical protein DLM78_20405 [Leptospira stimsonii]
MSTTLIQEDEDQLQSTSAIELEKIQRIMNALVESKQSFFIGGLAKEANDTFLIDENLIGVVKRIFESQAQLNLPILKNRISARRVTRISQNRYTNLINKSVETMESSVIPANAFDKLESVTDDQKKIFIKLIMFLKDYASHLRYLKLPILDIHYIEDHSILIEWIIDEARLGISVEEKPKNSFWYFHDFRKEAFISKSGFFEENFFSYLPNLLNNLFVIS